MSSAIYSTLIGVLGGGLFGFMIFQFWMIAGSLNRIADHLKDRGECLARIEARLGIDPPAEAA